MVVCSELGVLEEDIAHWPIDRVSRWVAFFQMRDEVVAKTFGADKLDSTAALLPSNEAVKKELKKPRRKGRGQGKSHSPYSL